MHRLGEPLQRRPRTRLVVIRSTRSATSRTWSTPPPARSTWLERRAAAPWRGSGRCPEPRLRSSARDTSSPSRTRSGCGVPAGGHGCGGAARRSSGSRGTTSASTCSSSYVARRMNCTWSRRDAEQTGRSALRWLPGARSTHAVAVDQHRAELDRHHDARVGQRVEDLAVRHQVGTPPGRPVEGDLAHGCGDPVHARSSSHLRVVETPEVVGNARVRRHHAVDVVADVVRQRQPVQASALWRRREDFLAGRPSSSSSSLLPPVIAFFAPLTAPLVFFAAPPSCRSPRPR